MRAEFDLAVPRRHLFVARANGVDGPRLDSRLLISCAKYELKTSKIQSKSHLLCPWLSRLASDIVIDPRQLPASVQARTGPGDLMTQRGIWWRFMDMLTAIFSMST